MAMRERASAFEGAVLDMNIQYLNSTISRIYAMLESNPELDQLVAHSGFEGCGLKVVGENGLARWHEVIGVRNGYFVCKPDPTPEDITAGRNTKLVDVSPEENIVDVLLPGKVKRL